jgi:uncharacterized repeat protein (TIGR03809 family)
MTDRTDVARGRDIVARWCGLAEQRLDYLTELFETGRWRRYYSETAFLDDIREAKAAVETWRDILHREATADNLPVDLSWIGRRSSVPPAKRDVPPEPIVEIAPQPAELVVMPELAELPVEPPVSVVPEEMEEAEPALALDPVDTDAESALEKTLALTLDIVGMAGRYPSLRNAFHSAERN